MSTRIVDAHDRVHVLTPGAEWTILRGFAQERGPCYISDVRTRPGGRPILTDGGRGWSVNTPLAGGLMGLGLVVAAPPGGVMPDDGSFWNHAWEITERLAGPSFGVTDPVVTVKQPNEVHASCGLNVLDRPAAALTWVYTFGPDDLVQCLLTIDFRPRPDLFLKEPKLTANGLHAYRRLAGHRDGKAVTVDLTRVKNPRAHTEQFDPETPLRLDLNPRLRAFSFQCAGWGPLVALADAGAPMSPLHSPAYCLEGGKLRHRTEVTRFGDADVAGIMAHGWEGGAGAPDCWACFRPWPLGKVALRASAGLGVPARLPSVPKPPPPPPPPAPPKVRWPDPPWNGLVLYAAWALKEQYTVDQLVDIASRMKARAVSIEATADNMPYQAELRTKLHARGIAYGLWGLSPLETAEQSIAYVRACQPDFYEADVEGAMKDPAWTQKFDAAFPDLPRRLLATGSLDSAYPGGAPIAEQPWLVNWDLAMQDYIVHGGNFDPEHAENFAFWRNFPVNASGHRHWPVLEIRAEGSQSLRDQLHLVAPWGRAFGAYTVEYLTDDDIAAAAAA